MTGGVTGNVEVARRLRRELHGLEATAAVADQELGLVETGRLADPRRTLSALFHRACVRDILQPLSGRF
jgi:hypothetical protein